MNIRPTLLALALASLTCLGSVAGSQPAALATREGDFTLHDFHFRSGESLQNLRLHYVTLGTPQRDASGKVTNAVLLLHGTVGSGQQFLRPQFAGELFGPGQLLDAQRYFIILPDDIGNGKSSKPSDGLRMRFPHYGYRDMVEAEHALVTQGLGIDHLRLVMGGSMGCMHAFLWGETWPQAMDALMPLACLPVPIAGRNRLFRTLTDHAVRADPAWMGGDYTSQPRAGLQVAVGIMSIADGSALQLQRQLPTAAAADAFADTGYLELPGLDANNLLYQIAASRDYDPSANLEAITAPVMWANSADDFINPPELGIAEREASRLKHGSFVLLPMTSLALGHGAHAHPMVWKPLLAKLLTQSAH